MQLLRRSASVEVSEAGARRRVPRGAWYPDPFGVGDERWWDGSQWTREVRSSVEAENADLSGDRRAHHDAPIAAGIRASAASQRPLDGSRRAEEKPGSRSDEPRASEFPVGIEAVLGEQLRIVPSLRKPGVHCQVLAERGRLGSISTFGHQLARLTCAHGAWFVKKSPSEAREFRIESVDHTQAGEYLRHQWMLGGTIRLADGTKFELRRSLPGRWKVCSADGSQRLAEIHRPVMRSAQPQGLTVTIHTLPADAARASMLILSACALLMLSADIA